jgi:predicted phage terminase large subunit-like protein
VSIVLRPNPGPQEAYLSTSADIAIYGGAAGSGKSYATALDVLRHVHRKGFGAVVFRRESTRLVGPGSIWEETSGIYPAFGAKARESPVLEWRFPSGALVEFRHLQHEKDRLGHSGKQYAGIYFDELTEFEESQFWFLLSRNRSTCGIRPYVRATCNPDPDSFVRQLIDWWIDKDGSPIPERSGVLRWFVRKDDDLVWGDSREELEERFPEVDENGERLFQPLSLTFVAAKLSDNPKGDPGYRAKLQALPRVDRERLLGGNWNVRAAAGLVFPRACWVLTDRVPCEIRTRIRAWDRAATKDGGDWTRGVLLYVLTDGRYVIADVQGIQGTPGEVEALILQTAAIDGRDTEVMLWQDPGAAGVSERDHMTDVLRGYRVHTVRAARNKLAYAGTWSARVEQSRVLVMKAPWTAAYISEHEAFPGGKNDDQVDATSGAFQIADGGASVGDWLAAMDQANW